VVVLIHGLRRDGSNREESSQTHDGSSWHMLDSHHCRAWDAHHQHAEKGLSAPETHRVHTNPGHLERTATKANIASRGPERSPGTSWGVPELVDAIGAQPRNWTGIRSRKGSAGGPMPAAGAPKHGWAGIMRPGWRRSAAARPSRNHHRGACRSLTSGVDMAVPPRARAPHGHRRFRAALHERVCPDQ
jgi:hypothetical protein